MPKGKPKQTDVRKESHVPRLGLAIESAVTAVNDADVSVHRKKKGKGKTKQQEPEAEEDTTRLTKNQAKGQEYSYYFQNKTNVLNIGGKKNAGARGGRKQGTRKSGRKSQRKSQKNSSEAERKDSNSYSRSQPSSSFSDGSQSSTSQSSDKDTDKSDESDMEDELTDFSFHPPQAEGENTRRQSVKIDVERLDGLGGGAKEAARWKQLTGNVSVRQLSIFDYMNSQSVKQAQKQLTSGQNYGVDFNASAGVISIVKYESKENKAKGRRNHELEEDYELFLSEVPEYKNEFTESDWPPAPPKIIPPPPEEEHPSKPQKKGLDRLPKPRIPRMNPQMKRSSYHVAGGGEDFEGFRFLVNTFVPIALPPPPEPKSPPEDGSQEQKLQREREVVAMSCEDLLVKLRMIEETTTLCKTGIRKFESKIEQADLEISKLIPHPTTAKTTQETSTILSAMTGRQFEVEKQKKGVVQSG